MPEGDTIHYAANRIREALVGSEIVEIATQHPRHRADRWPERLHGRAVRRSAQRSFAWRGWGISIDLISLPTSAAPTRRAARWMLSPSGMAGRLRIGASAHAAL